MLTLQAGNSSIFGRGYNLSGSGFLPEKNDVDFGSLSPNFITHQGKIIKIRAFFEDFWGGLVTGFDTDIDCETFLVEVDNTVVTFKVDKDMKTRFLSTGPVPSLESKNTYKIRFCL